MGKKMFFKPFKPGPSYSLMAMGTSGEEKRDAHPGERRPGLALGIVDSRAHPQQYAVGGLAVELDGSPIEIVGVGRLCLGAHALLGGSTGRHAGPGIGELAPSLEVSQGCAGIGCQQCTGIRMAGIIKYLP